MEFNNNTINNSQFNINYNLNSHKHKYCPSIKRYLENIQGCQKCEGGEECYGLFKNKKRIIAIGDLHGDFEVLIAAFLKAKLIDKNDNWIGGDTHVVQLGDILDRGGRGSSVETNENEELYILKFLEEMDNKAKQDGGRVLCVIGNHELMNLMSDFRYTTDNTRRMFDIVGSPHTRETLFRPGGLLANKIACMAFGIIKVNDWIFVHAGLLPEHLKNTKSINDKFKKINNLVKDIFTGTRTQKQLSNEEHNLIFGSQGIFWTREFSKQDFQCNDIDKIANSFTPMKLNKGGIIVGHTPQQGIDYKCNKRIWFVDNAMSKAFGDKENPSDRVQILEISYKNKKEIIKVIK